MQRPSDESIAIVRFIDGLQSLGYFSIFLAFLDIWGGAPTYSNSTLLLASLGATIVLRFTVYTIVTHWTFTYFERIETTPRDIVIIVAAWILTLAIPAVTYWFAMDSSLQSLALITVATAGFLKYTTSYSFSVNDTEVVSG